MLTATFDTHRFYQKFTHDGFTENQANDVIEFVSEAIAAKNADSITRPEQTVFKSEMKADFAELRSDMQQMESDLRSDMQKMENGIRSDMQKMENGIRSDMQKMENGIRSDMHQMENGIRSDMHQMDSKINQLDNRVTLLATNMKWGFGLLFFVQPLLPGVYHTIAVLISSLVK